MTARLGMGNQRDPMRTQNVKRIRICLQRSSYNIQITQHGGGEEIETRAVFQQEARDISSTHVRSSTETGFEVTAAPIPDTVDQGRFLCHQLLDSF